MLSSVQIFSLVLCLGLTCIFLGITLYAIVLTICQLAPSGGTSLNKIKNLAVSLMAGGVVVDSLLFVVVCLYEVFHILGG